MKTAVPFIFTALLLIFSCFMSPLIERERIASKRKRFELRPALEIDEIYERFFKDKADYKRFVIHWAKISEILQLDPKLLLPTDRFDFELSRAEGFPMYDEIEDLEEYYRIEWSKIHPNQQAPRVDSLYDLIINLSAHPEEPDSRGQSDKSNI
jgi:hypothetical protein